MADRKITDLTALGAGSQATGDLLTIVDVSEAAATDKNKKITVESLFKGIPSNVGIGESSPDTALHVKGTASSQLTIERDGTGSQIAGIIFKDGSGDQNRISCSDQAIRFAYGSGNAESMRIDSSGNVGIGTTSPSGLLHTVQASGTGRVRFEASAAHSFARLIAASTSYNSGVEFFSGTTNTANITAQGGGELVVEANGSERMRIDSFGNSIQYSTGTLNRQHRQQSSSVYTATNIRSVISGATGYLAFDTGTNWTNGNAVERMRILADGGITFNGDTAQANALDDYEEGTWTAAINTTNSNATVSANNTTGYYVKVGSMVTAYYYSSNINITAVGSGAGIITGLPFTVANLTNGFATATVTHATIFSSQIQNGYADPNNTRIVFVGEGTTSGIGLTTGNPLYLMVSLTYRAA